MKLNKKLSLFIVLMLFLSACNPIQETNPSITALPIDSPWSRNGVVFEKPIWKIIKGENNSTNSIHVEVPVKNNNNVPTDVSFYFELWSSQDNSGNVLATCSTSSDSGSNSVGANNTVSSNGKAIMQCTHTIYEAINEADFSSYSLRYGVIADPLEENRPDGIEVLETGFEKTGEDVSTIRYTLYVKIQSKFDQEFTTRFYVLDDQGLQFMGCETDTELKTETTARIECELEYRIDMIKRLPASLIVDVIKWEQ